MEAAINCNNTGEIFAKVKAVSEMFRISKLEKMLSDCFEKLPETSPVDYIGELNKNDLFH